MDRALHDFLRADGWVESVAHGMTVLGGTEVLVATAVASVYMLRRAGLGWWASSGPLGSLWVCTVVTTVVKDLVGRARPEAGVGLSSAAFPSGHASNTTALVVALALVVPLVSVAVPRKRALLVAAAASLVMGWTRLALGVHWATDVVAGWVLGASVATVVTRAVVTRELRGSPADPGPA